jgi:hypothetical protein
MQLYWLPMTDLAAEAILAFASRADAMTNTIPAGLAQVGQVEPARWVCGVRCWAAAELLNYYA